MMIFWHKKKRSPRAIWKLRIFAMMAFLTLLALGIGWIYLTEYVRHMFANVTTCCLGCI